MIFVRRRLDGWRRVRPDGELQVRLGRADRVDEGRRAAAARPQLRSDSGSVASGDSVTPSEGCGRSAALVGCATQCSRDQETSLTHPFKKAHQRHPSAQLRLRQSPQQI